MTEATAFAAPPDLLKRFVAAPFSASLATHTSVYVIGTNYAPLCEWLVGAEEGPGTRWDCAILCDPEYPIEPDDALTFASEDQLLHLRPGYLISVDPLHHRIVAFLSVVSDRAAVRSLMREMILLSQTDLAGERSAK